MLHQRVDFSITPDDIDNGGVIHGVVHGGIFEFHLLEDHPVALGHLGHLCQGSTQADGAGIEIAGVFIRNRRGISFRIDADKDRLDLFALFVGHAFQRHRHLAQGGNADVRAAGITKVKRDDFALEVMQIDRPLRGLQGEVATHIGIGVLVLRRLPQAKPETGSDTGYGDQDKGELFHVVARAYSDDWKGLDFNAFPAAVPSVSDA